MDAPDETTDTTEEQWDQLRDALGEDPLGQSVLAQLQDDPDLGARALAQLLRDVEREPARSPKLFTLLSGESSVEKLVNIAQVNVQSDRRSGLAVAGLVAVVVVAVVALVVGGREVVVSDGDSNGGRRPGASAVGDDERPSDPESIVPGGGASDEGTSGGGLPVADSEETISAFCGQMLSLRAEGEELVDEADARGDPTIVLAAQQSILDTMEALRPPTSVVTPFAGALDYTREVTAIRNDALEALTGSPPSDHDRILDEVAAQEGALQDEYATDLATMTGWMQRNCL